ncbi:MAG: ABC-F family ATP-binding cassette domain-containing protein, partial [Clostridia bacterium]|nr:ABC-F family ATP-binding cassette domain-containing protein [Clostridia bacterium]
MLINGDNLSKSFGVRTLFEGVSFNIEEKDRVGLVGANGTGKTTLFEILRGEAPYDEGNLVRSKNLKLGYMKQQVTLGGEKTAYEVTLEGFQHLVDMETELDEIAISIEKGNADSKLLERQHILREKYENMGGLTFRSKIKSALTGLGLSDEEQNLPMSSLSGGQRSKVSLAGLLVSDANMLLLDEPTNHLDISAIEWLESFLSTYRGAFIVISHDRYFLDKVTNRTFEIQNQRVAVFEGNYSAYLDFKEKKLEDGTKHYENQKKEIERLEQVVKQQRQWNREKSIKRAESKQKVIDKLEAALEKPEREEDTIHFSFKTELAG